MNPIRLFIRRPVAVTMMYCVLAALGLYFFQKLPLEQLPTANLPGLTVETQWNNATPETVEAFVTSPIEAISNTLKGVKEVSSTSSESRSLVNVKFVEGTDIDFAVMEMNEKLSVLTEELPRSVMRPEVTPSSVGGRSLGLEDELPLQYYITGNFTHAWIQEYAEKYIETPLKSLESVSDVLVYGGQKRMIKVEIDRKKAEMFFINEYQIRNLISSLEVKQNAGYIYQGDTRYDLFVENTAERLDQVRELRVRNYRGDLIPITEIAEIIDDFEEPFYILRINGNPRIGIRISQKEGSNTIEFANQVADKFEELKRDFPPTLQVILDYDPSTRVEKELANIEARAIFCILVIFGVLYLFLRNLKVPLLILTTILFSELITIILFYWFGIGFNIMTIAGLALGFGMLVDSSIVVIDNIFRYRERGQSAEESAEKGAREVFMPLVASVLTTSIVFIPFLYLTGDNRLVYVPMAMAVVFSLISSVLVSFSFIPTFALKVFPDNAESIRESIRKNKFLGLLTGLYGNFIDYVIEKKYWTIATVLVLFAGSIFIYSKTSSTFGYYGGSGEATYIGIIVRLPKGSEIERADEIAKEFENRTVGREGIRKVSTRIVMFPYEYVRIQIEFSDDALETVLPYVVKDEMTAYGATFAGVAITVTGYGDYFSSGGFGSSGYNFTIRVFGYNYNEVGVIADNVGKVLERIPRVRNIDTKGSGNRSSDIFESVISFDREALSRHNITMQEVVAIVDRYLRGGNPSTTIKIDGEQVRFEVKVKDFEKFQLDQLENVAVTIPGTQGRVRLSEIAVVDRQRTMVEIRRNKQQYQRDVRFEYRGPNQLGEKIVEMIVENTNENLQPGYKLETVERFWSMGEEEKTELWLVILFAVVLVYMTTSSLYESLLHPLIIILTVPMAMIGVLLTFFFAGQKFDRSAYIGVILLAGIVVNNSIILLDHINLLRRKGMELREAVVQGCKDRVRPILMTSATTIMGLLPLIAFSSATRGYGREWYMLSLASIGGLLSATPLTLSVIPALYIVFEQWRRSFRSHWRESGG